MSQRSWRRSAPVSTGCDRGAVTAELAMVLPLLVALTIGLVWVLSVGAAQLRVIDAARETARAIARGDDVAAAVAVGERIAPEGGHVAVASAGVDGGGVLVEASARIAGPGLVLGWLPGVTVRAEAAAVGEIGP